MSSSTLRRRAVLGAATLALTAGAVVAGGASAHAAPAHQAPAVVQPASTTFTLRSGQSALMPTWVWSGTTICAYGPSAGLVTLQAGASGAEYLPANRCVTRWWGGVPVRVTNVAAATVTVSGT